MKYLLFVLLLSSQITFASVEGMIPLTEFRLYSEGLGDSGKLVIVGTTDKFKLVSLVVKAFGKEYKAPPQVIARVQDQHVNGVSMSYESGYKETGGRTIYVSLTSGFSGDVKSKIVVRITEEGLIEVVDRLSNKLT